MPAGFLMLIVTLALGGIYRSGMIRRDPAGARAALIFSTVLLFVLYAAVIVRARYLTHRWPFKPAVAQSPHL